MQRQIVRIDEELCTGCGLCVTPCAEGAIQIIDGTARVIREELCDGAGFCLSERVLKVLQHCGGMSCQPLKHQSDHGGVDHRLTGFRQLLIVFTQAPIAS